MKAASGLSQRGMRALDTVMRSDMEWYFKAIENQYDALNNPAGAFPMNVAENRQNWEMLKHKLQAIGSQSIPDWVAAYTSGKGAPTFRTAVAQFLSKYLTKSPVEEDTIAISAGATSVVELTAILLGDENDVVAFPAPCYPVYKQDVGNVARLQRYDIQTHYSIQDLQNGLPLRPQHLTTTLKTIQERGQRLCAVVLTSPDNPTGGIYSHHQLLEIADWCIAHDVHLIVNELYGLSSINTSHPSIADDYSDAAAYHSFGQIIHERKSPYLHLWYAFSKDFGISGFRIGVVHSLNPHFLQAYENLNYPRLVSNHTQWLLQEVLADDNFLTLYFSITQRLLTESYVSIVEVLKKHDVAYVPSRGSLFIWMDLSSYLQEESKAGEDELWRRCYERTGILLTPADGFGHQYYGCFRMVYPCFQKKALAVAMQRFSDFLSTEKR